MLFGRDNGTAKKPFPFHTGTGRDLAIVSSAPDPYDHGKCRFGRTNANGVVKRVRKNAGSARAVTDGGATCCFTDIDRHV
jgi:hypothetical protein